MGSVEGLGASSNSSQSVQVRSTGSDWEKTSLSGRPPPGGEWHSVPLEDSSNFGNESSWLGVRGRLDSLIIAGADGKKNMAGTLSRLVVDVPHPQEHECAFVTFGSAVKEVRVSLQGLDEVTNTNDNTKTERMVNDTGVDLGCGDDGCVPLLHQVRAFIKGVKLSCSMMTSGDSKAFHFEGWSSVFQRSFSYRSCETASVDGELPCRSKSTSALVNSVSSAPAVTSKLTPSCTIEVPKIVSLQARDPQARADSLPLAHYRPTDGPVWKEEELSPGQVSLVGGIKSPGNCKKPPRHPGRLGSVDSATMAALRSARKNRDRASTKRKSKAAAAASTGITPLVALILTIGFGVLMVFQGVFVQTSVSYGRSNDGAFVDLAAVRAPLVVEKALPFQHINLRTPRISASSSVDGRSHEEAVVTAFQKSMEDLPWSRSSIFSQVESS